MSPLAGTGALLRFAIRRDRWLLPAWIIGLALTPAFSAAATVDLYPDEASRVEASTTINATASLVALYGKIYDPAAVGALSLIKLTAFGCALVSVVFVFITVRHTRSEEESGRVELLASGRSGRLAPLMAALLLGFIASIALGLLTGLGLIAVGLPLSGSFAFGAAWAMSGIVFTAATAVAAQTTVSHRASIGLGVTAVAAAYLLRAVGDLASGDPGVLSWLSPIGWSQQIRPFAGDRWAITAIPLIATAILVPLGFWLRSSRDLGSGLLPEREGRPAGRIGTAAGLAWRLQRGSLIAWVVGVAVMSVILGSIAHTVTGLLSSATMQQYLVALGGEQALVDAFLAAEIAIMGSIVAAYSIAATMRLHSEEDSGHAESLLATSITRARWSAGHLIVAVVGTAALLIVAGAGTGLGHGLAIGDVGGQILRLAMAAIATLPAALVMGSIVMLLFGWLPRATQAAWAVLVVSIVLGEFGVLWNLPQWVLDLSPFAHSPRLPGGTVEGAQVIGLVCVAVALTVIGLVGLRRRNIA